MRLPRRFLVLPLSALLAGCPTEGPDEPPAPLSLTAVTFNTGTTESMGHDVPPDDGYGSQQSAISDTWYGDGLAWSAVVEDTRTFFAATPADVVGFQEIFYSGECADIPSEAHEGFVCEDWQPGDPTVALTILPDGWQVACHIDKSDKCLAVRRGFGTIAGCDGDLCLDGLIGAEVDTCGSGSRVGRAVLELEVGGTLTVVNVHGSSGLGADDKECRLAQFQLVFDDLGDGSGEPAANGERNVIVGDFNTDPGRWTASDASAAYLAEQASTTAFQFHTEVGPDAEPTYGGIANIDHVLSDAFQGDCWTAGLSLEHPDVSSVVYLDHKPTVCALTEL
jgi:hypothetical protein